MNILGSVGALYMLILILLLIVGFGLTGLKFINYIFGTNQQSVNKEKINIVNSEAGVCRWLKVTLISLVGIAVCIMFLILI